MNYYYFPFGKYKGTPINEIPNTYLVYALQEFSLPEELEDELKLTLISNLGIVINVYDLSVVKKTYRELSKIYHPDKGGSDKEMAAISHFYNSLIGK
jgi:uncharacterized protein (DUF3820 family)